MCCYPNKNRTTIELPPANLLRSDYPDIENITVASYPNQHSECSFIDPDVFRFSAFTRFIEYLTKFYGKGLPETFTKKGPRYLAIDSPKELNSATINDLLIISGPFPDHFIIELSRIREGYWRDFTKLKGALNRVFLFANKDYIGAIDLFNGKIQYRSINTLDYRFEPELYNYAPVWRNVTYPFY
jgi:hypothetical protein